MNNSMNLGGGVQKCIYMLSKYFTKDNKIYIASSGGEYAEELKEYGVKHFSIVNPENKNPINILKNILRIRKIVKNNSIDVIHSHHRMTTLYAKIVSKVCDVKVVHTSHLYTEDKVKLSKITLKNIPIITVSKGVKQGLINIYKLDKENITNIYNTIEFNNNNDNVYKELMIEKENGSFIVTSICRLEPVKGLDILLEAVQKISRIQNNVVFFILGEGSERIKLTKFIKNNNLEKMVHLVGNVPNVRAYLERTDVLVQCSYREGLPLAVAEAASLGVPAIASDIPGLNEIIINGYNGMTIPPGDSDAIVDSLLHFINNRDLINKMSKNGIKHFNENFSKDKYYNDHIKVYSRLIE
ncbi:glycosyltransferase [Metabacillus idriensis]|uniref:glycosyltransferase n=1 Tax=Metabacillus idriensis TaxID=324768 RepID=UPI00203B5726|nr:glycosyltransferase [Metabacillus idriensis]MCM3597513.1 glycosyltransferase [Metabacillus idriensis]